ncbi:hypothetical protein EJ03DRAFT_185568 [Teratosphaeria nubilosa]|uniref:Uncharacterized protein n=1 Tax=Teratosphaeria nubilosa TaxID=161662 RepID=A0A6G1LIM0_9PEZI|nr:hypothetical protein EJ03DRAFT_185568 [Teratosphaeria nubilosa]
MILSSLAQHDRSSLPRCRKFLSMNNTSLEPIRRVLVLGVGIQPNHNPGSHPITPQTGQHPRNQHPHQTPNNKSSLVPNSTTALRRTYEYRDSIPQK